ncbi:hypothetical protein [Flexibacterium corallicola]|uniref:hypothetical protein n=1 Tax=Flexibacterium corallicola TaxID=3037259 RepID=UPI00286F75D7|nr:hypothetical protein [Pseudovibrio sp. M1P-2-3]
MQRHLIGSICLGFYISYFLVISVSQAMPLWPERARGKVLPPPRWVLVVPIELSQIGDSIQRNLEVDYFIEDWAAPLRTIGGVNLISFKPDAEDHRLLDLQSLLELEPASLEYLTAKFMAPSIALVLRDGNGWLSVALWVKEHGGAWTEGAGGRREAVKLIDTLMLREG